MHLLPLQADVKGYKQATHSTWSQETPVLNPACMEVGTKCGVCDIVAPQALQPQHTLTLLLGLALLLHLSLNRNLEPFGPFVIFYEHTNSLEILPEFFLPALSRSIWLIAACSR